MAMTGPGAAGRRALGSATPRPELSGLLPAGPPKPSQVGSVAPVDRPDRPSLLVEAL